MADVIEIGIPIEEIYARGERVAKTKRFETPDRVAVIPAIISAICYLRSELSSEITTMIRK